MKIFSFIIAILFSVLLICGELRGQSLSDSLRFSGQLVGWAGANFSKPNRELIGGRYLPELSYTHNSAHKISFDLDASANIYSNLLFTSWQYDTISAQIKPYRLSARISSDQWEIRAGLQKISFGSASILRPLMWFDKTDARDPLKFTDGVYGILGRYYFLNNANIWLWGLYGNTNPRGWDPAKTSRNKPEFGGRLQLPLSAGEFGLSYNHRLADSRELIGIPSYSEIPESKFGFDIKLDKVIGCWLEGSWTVKGKDLGILSNQEILNLGMDYTFGVGNGIYFIVEQLLAASSRDAFDFNKPVLFTLASASYPVGLFDNINAMVYYDWKNKNSYNFLNWQKQLNKFSLHLMAYWNPEKFIIPAQGSGENLFAGKGIQLMLVYNH